MRVTLYPALRGSRIALVLAAGMAATALAGRQQASQPDAKERGRLTATERGHAPEIELRQKGGERAEPDALGDDDLKIAGLMGLLSADPAEAVPLLEKLVASAKSLRVREQALFVLSQSGSPRAREVVISIARGQASPALAAKAIECLGILGAAKDQQVLAEIYAQSNDTDGRRAVLRAFMIGGDKEHLLQAARSEPQLDLRREAVRLLGATGARAELAQLYAGEADRDVKEAVLQGQMTAGDATRLVQTARNEKDPELRRTAVRMLSVMDSPEGRQLLLEILDK